MTCLREGAALLHAVLAPNLDSGKNVDHGGTDG